MMTPTGHRVSRLRRDLPPLKWSILQRPRGHTSGRTTSEGEDHCRSARCGSGRGRPRPPRAGTPPRSPSCWRRGERTSTRSRWQEHEQLALAQPKLAHVEGDVADRGLGEVPAPRCVLTFPGPPTDPMPLWTAMESATRELRDALAQAAQNIPGRYPSWGATRDVPSPEPCGPPVCITAGGASP